METVLVTGAAGFVGAFLTKALLKDGYRVVGVDNLNAYYDVALKKSRLATHCDSENFEFAEFDFSDRARVEELFQSHKFKYVFHMGAQAGVRYSLENPHTYIDSNIVGFVNILEGCRHHDVEHLIYASSSSVYGMNSSIPFAETDPVDHPVSLYAATKRSNELMAHSYASLYNLPCTGLRFFTVYGPWGRPDMAYFSFTKAIISGEEIKVFNNGDMRRDFTYIDDIVEGIQSVALKPPIIGGSADAPNSSSAPFQIFNIGNNQPVRLLDFINVLEKLIGKKANKKMLPMQPGDVYETYSNIDSLQTVAGFTPSTSIENGLRQFVDWYLSYYTK